MEGTCPFDGLTEEEFAVRKREYRLFEAAQQLRHELSRLLNCESDSLVPVEEWGGKEGALRDPYEGLLQKMLRNEVLMMMSRSGLRQASGTFGRAI